MTSTQRLDIGPEDMERGFAQIRAAMESVPTAARQEVLNSNDLVNKVVGIIVPEMDKRFRRKYYPIIIAAVGALLLLFAVGAAVVFDRVGDQDVTNLGQDASIKRSEQTIQAFKDQLRAANASLVAQGLPPILGPEDAAPGSPEQAQLINAAAVAATLSRLGQDPQVATRAVSTPEAAKVIATEVTRQVQVAQPMAQPDQIINAVGEYVRANGLPRGPAGENGAAGAKGDTGAQGPAGPAGPAPTTEEIRSAFQSEVAANPQVLCPQGGDYTSQNVVLVGGGSATQFGCFGNVQPAPDPDPVPEPNTPAPTTAPEPPPEPAPTTTQAPTPPVTQEPAPTTSDPGGLFE